MLPFHDTFATSADGLRLHARGIGPLDAAVLPVLCLPGLTRTAQDFDVIAQALAGDPQTPRRVVAVDYRGRGGSDFDPNPANYTVPMETTDVLALAGASGISRAIWLGTSRGGLISIVIAATRPELVAGIILNDIGPELDIKGLMKIKGYLAPLVTPQTWGEAAHGLQRLFGSVFPALTDNDWMAWAQRAFRQDANGKLIRTYDPALAQTFDGISPETPPTPLWELFDQMVQVPLLSIRGELSDLLSRACVAEMKRRRPDMETCDVPLQGHAPLLADAPTIERIKAFCRKCDGAGGF
ncbi:alpha/beta hydrolase [[Pseudomonas] carboxydohydrogena]|uniref:Alpha/beta hydrolase n=1 Tax=Afipia carboxydohydrogena TaxID=290 RepID=A0ABY8BTM2_AFICR|nr:alpha/beta hydrolase [[Pseudomonas] carboxydohydrogena]WEF52946.1 alpha/beta hydrolase [[Pseudomonas] carboxydohydrogena]